MVNGTREFNGRLCDGDPGCDDATVMSFSFDTSLVGFAADWASTTSGDLLTMIINGTTIKFTDHLSGAGAGFLGIHDPAGFSSIQFGLEDVSTAFAELFQMDDARLATLSTGNVPEPGSLALLALGLAGLGCWRRRAR